MGKHVFTLSLRMEVDSPAIEHGESGAILDVTPETLYASVANLRNDLLTDIDDFTAGEFEEAIGKANEINAILSQIEEFAPFEGDSDDD